MYDDMMASCRRISLACSLSAFSTVNHFTFLDILCRNFRIFTVYLFHEHALCLHFSRYFIYLSDIEYARTSNCFMSTYFTDMLFVYIFHGILFIFLV